MNTVALLMVVASLAPPQDLAKPITYKSPAMTVDRILAELAPLSGLELKVSPAVASEVLVISVKDMPLGKLLNRIADVTSSRWEESGPRWSLVYSASKLRLEEAEDRKARLAEVRREFDSIRKELNPKPPTKGEAEKPPQISFRMNSGGPGEKAISRIVLDLDPGIFADIKEDERVVFATAPTQMQRPLPSTATAILNRLVTEQNEHARQIAESKADNPPTKEEQDMLAIAGRFGMGDDDKKISAPPVKALLTAERGMFMPGLELRLVLFDRNGTVVFTTQSNLNVGGSNLFGMDMEEIVSEATKPKDKPATTPNEAPIEYSALTAEKLKTSVNMMNPGQTPDMSDALHAALARPDLRDPLSYRESEGLIALAESKKLNLIANLPDAIISTFSMGARPQKESPSQFFTWLTNNKQITIQTEGNELTVRPAKPVESRASRANRYALAQLIAVAERNNSVSIDEMAKYALRSPAPMKTPAAIESLMLFAPNVMSNGMAGLTDWNVLRLYGSLSPDQKTALRNGGRLNFGTIGQDSKPHLFKILFGPNSPIRKDPATANMDEEGGLMDFALSFMGGNPKDFREEPTEIMPTGLPAMGELLMTTKVDTIVKPADSKNAMMRMMGSLGSTELALLDFMRDQPFLAEMGGMFPQIDKVIAGKRTQITMRFIVAPQVSGTARLNDDAFDPKESPVSYSSLPKEFLDKVEKRKDAFKKAGSPFDFLNRQKIDPPVL